MGATDPRLFTGLRKMQRAYRGLLSTRSAAIDQYNADKDALDARWQAELTPVLQDLYWHPFRNGIGEAPEDADKLREWLEDRLTDAATIVVLLLLLQRYHVQAANLGGQTALNLLDLDATFALTNEAYLQQMADRATMLTTQGSEQSLIDTTINDLATALPAARASAQGVLMALAAYITSRAAQRTVLIERYERPWGVANGLGWTYQHNGVGYVMYDVNGVGCPQICAPDHGLVFPLGARGRSLPRHSGCDCIWSAVRYNGQTVGFPPVTVSVPGLAPWTPPAQVWAGGALP